MHDANRGDGCSWGWQWLWLWLGLGLGLWLEMWQQWWRLLIELNHLRGHAIDSGGQGFLNRGGGGGGVQGRGGSPPPPSLKCIDGTSGTQHIIPPPKGQSAHLNLPIIATSDDTEI